MEVGLSGRHPRNGGLLLLQAHKEGAAALKTLPPHASSLATAIGPNVL